MYQELLRVPLIVSGPGISPGRVAAPVSLLDVSVTILERALAIPPARLIGRSLLPRDGSAPERHKQQRERHKQERENLGRFCPHSSTSRSMWDRQTDGIAVKIPFLSYREDTRASMRTGSTYQSHK